jgi:hypothetical protein
VEIHDATVRFGESASDTASLPAIVVEVVDA